MKIKFIIPYKTQFGEELLILGSLSNLGGWNQDQAVKLTYCSGDIWETQFELTENFQYKYLFKDVNGKIIEENFTREIDLHDFLKESTITIYDFWQNPKNYEALFLTSAFKDVIFKPENFSRPKKIQQVETGRDLSLQNEHVYKKNNYYVKLQLNLARINPKHKLCLVGDLPELGNWDVKKALELGNQNYPVWQLDFNVDTANFSYKYLLKDQDNNFAAYEEGPNRFMQVENAVTMINDFPFRYANNWRGSGIAVPVFSLLSEQSLGIGEFLDLKLLIDFASESGFNLIQLLPINDTSVNLNWLDSYPYSGLSVFALHLIYLNIEQLGNLTEEQKQELELQKKTLNILKKVDYEKVYTLKIRLAKEIFEVQKAGFLDLSDFKVFLAENAIWLKPYACFCVLRDKFKTSDFSCWGNFAKGNLEIVRELTNPKAKEFSEVSFYYFLQYHLHLQLIEVSKYAQAKRIVLKGDIPIGINKFSDSAWVSPTLFNLDQSAGAPPDVFSEAGQNWGFPTYNWETMAQDDFAWWKLRLRVMARYFQMVRIDHVLGFFRIWQIPTKQISGELGIFNPNLAYTENELKALGFADLDRLLAPYITDKILDDLFGSKAKVVKEEFLIRKKANGIEENNLASCLCERSDAIPNFRIGDCVTNSTCQSVSPEVCNGNKYTIKIEYADQIKAAALIKDSEIQKGFLKLISNVLFLKDHVGGLNPRFDLISTSSFKALSENEQKILTDLYFDYFYRRHESFWQENALIKLPMIKSAANMLICGEDLGMVPDCVPKVLEALSLLSLKIQRMPKETDREFGNTETYPYLSVCSPSSHDISTIRAWWEEDPVRTQRYFEQVLGLLGKAPVKCTPELCELIVKKHLESPSMWAIFPLQDLLNTSAKLSYKGDPKDEQINHPEIANYYWQYRVHLKLEELLKEPEFMLKLRRLNDVR
ncbi:MAG: 4-alpha-glucanotransferase [Candidatus Margulisiibacteriota bacterium]|jgi:4-alpha-glucanotransferase